MIPVQAQRATLGTFELSATHAGDIDVILSDLSGWGAPASSAETEQKPGRHGVWVSDGFHVGKYMTAMGSILAPSRDDARQKFDDLVAAATLTDTTLTVVEGALTRTVTVRRTGDVTYQPESDGKTVNWSTVLMAADPRKTQTNLTGSTGLPATSGGMTFPMTFPFTFSETVTSGVVTLTNPGNAPGRVTLKITAGVGGLTGPAVTHIASGITLQFAASLTIPEGNWIYVDMEARKVLENSQPGAERNGWVTGRGWSEFQPGANQWAFTAESGDGTLEVTATPSWW